MLTIKRVPTVVSNYQEDVDADVNANANANANDNCCLPFSNLPLYCFKSGRQASEASPSGFFLHGLLLVEWEERMRRGLFRYDVRTCETKVIPGKYGFIAQLNEGRHLKKRPTEFRVDRVLQPFDPAKFNFIKIGQEEALFCFEEAAAGAGGDDGSKAGFFKSPPIGGTANPSIVAINVSPIDYGHVLLIPRVLEWLPQRIDHESFLLALHMAAEAGSPCFRLAYNSLGAFATINHLHFQAYYLAIPFPVENASRQKISISKGLPEGVTVSRPLDYPVRVLVFEGGNNLKELSDLVADSCIWLQENNIPFNVLISDQGRRIFLYPQCYAEKQALGEVSQELLETQVNPAAWEISGHMVLKRREDFEEASEAKAWRLLAEVSLSEERFQEVKAYIFEATGLVESQKEGEEMMTETQFQPTTPVSTNLPEGCFVPPVKETGCAAA